MVEQRNIVKQRQMVKQRKMVKQIFHQFFSIQFLKYFHLQLPKIENNDDNDFNNTTIYSLYSVDCHVF